MEYLIFFAPGLILGFILGHLWGKRGQKPTNQPDSGGQLLPLLQEKEAELRGKNEELLELHKALSAQEPLIDQLREQSQAQESELQRLQEEMYLRFEQMANQLLEEKGQRLKAQSQEQLQQLLQPLGQQLRRFEQDLVQMHQQSQQKQAQLDEQLRQLFSLNQTIGQEAKELSQALKGNLKLQGNWGEQILERLFEASGLSKRYMIRTQAHFVTPDGRKRQPDFIVQLPQNRQLIVDSKVSLRAYLRYMQAEEGSAAAARAKKEHLQAIKQHIKGLSEKKYELLPQLNSLDYVLLFIPVEPAFLLALEEEEELFFDALQQNIVLVSPSSLLVSLRTIAQLWRQEQQNENAQQIARQGGRLYDRFVLWVEKIESLGKQIKTVQNNYDKILYDLRDQRNSLINESDKLRSLGSQNSRQLPDSMQNKEEEL